MSVAHLQLDYLRTTAKWSDTLDIVLVSLDQGYGCVWPLKTGRVLGRVLSYVLVRAHRIVMDRSVRIDDVPWIKSGVTVASLHRLQRLLQIPRFLHAHPRRSRHRTALLRADTRRHAVREPVPHAPPMMPRPGSRVRVGACGGTGHRGAPAHGLKVSGGCQDVDRARP